MRYQSVLAFRHLDTLQAPITINHAFTGACNKSINMGKWLYIIVKYIRKTFDNLFVQDIYQHHYKVDDVIKYTQKQRQAFRMAVCGVQHLFF